MGYGKQLGLQMRFAEKKYKVYIVRKQLNPFVIF